MGLDTVFSGADTAVPIIMTYLQLREPKLNPRAPSPAEALLSLAVCMVLDQTRDFPFLPIPVSLIDLVDSILVTKALR